ncbi:EcsC family protein [Bacillus sp. PS06]|uniref:EcsC family protein n=1 Tax=Bacillus sp. PS06 TaxID=2764176 RepID=UPI00177E6BC1|nr:EcsC family protein [Bacillus sp. PS06]MBD8068975.1 EcsC family protein [Bacillus sp. PS06]
MVLSEREKKVLEDINHWREQLYDYELTDFQMTYDKLLEQSFQLVPDEVRTEFFAKIDNWLFHLHAVIQGTQLQMDARDRIITSARAFHDEVDQLSDLKNLTLDQLAYLADHQIAKHRVYSFAQGGLVGTGGLLLVGTDILTMTIINLRAVQLIAMTYGYETSTPYEMMLSLKVFHGATLPKNLKHRGWEELIEELDGATDNPFFYEGTDHFVNEAWVKQPLKQILKGFVIFMFRKKLIQGLPLVGMTIGASMNYQFTRQVTEFAHKFYQYRYLNEKVGNEL